jgi:hypothetical protein
MLLFSINRSRGYENPSLDIIVTEHCSIGRSSPTFTLNRTTVDDEGLLTDLVSTDYKNSKATLRSVAATLFFVGGHNFLL